jgi:hypothetical protein
VPDGADGLKRDGTPLVTPAARTSNEVPVVSQNAEAIVAALDAVWVIIRRDGLERVRADGLRRELNRVTTEARAANMPPEQLLWLLKSSWRGLPEVRKVDRPELASDLLGQMVTICIQEYFA